MSLILDYNIGMRLQNKTPVIHEGPFIDEAGEQLSAYYAIDCESLDRAISIAERILDFHVTTVEVRQVHDSAGM